MRTKSPFERWGGRGLGQETVTELARAVHWTVRLVRTLLAKPTSSPNTPDQALGTPFSLRAMRKNAFHFHHALKEFLAGARA